jgi:RNA polymerase sigma-70 factor (sigma-E family)
MVVRGVEPATPDRRLEEQRHGGARSLEALYGERYQSMVRLAYLLTGSASVAEDLVQDSFAGLYERWDRVREPSAYLRVSVVNACRAFHRRASRERARFADLVSDEVSADTPIVLDALAALPYKQRAALVLRYWEDRPETDIAEFLGCRPATVRSLVQRGLRALREVIEQ